jgi:hypothetical protein
VTAITAAKVAKSHDAPREDDCWVQERSRMSTGTMTTSIRSMTVDPLRIQSDRRQAARRKEDLWLLAMALVMSVVVSFIAVITLT